MGVIAHSDASHPDEVQSNDPRRGRVTSNDEKGLSESRFLGHEQAIAGCVQSKPGFFSAQFLNSLKPIGLDGCTDIRTTRG